MDITKLTPGPWIAQTCDGDQDERGCWHVSRAIQHDDQFGRNVEIIALSSPATSTDAQFIALARNDLDVKQRRGWHTEKCTDADQWLVPQLVEHLCGKTKQEGDALIAAMYQQGHDVGLLTKADQWYRENVENKQAN